MVCSLLQAAPNASDFKAKFLSSISPPNLKPLCAASAAETLWPVLPLLFRHYREAADSSVLSLSHFHRKKATHKETGHSTYKPQSILSLQQTLSWDTLGICTAVSTARTFVCLSGTDSSPCQELRAQQVTGQCHLMEERPMQRGKSGRRGAAKGTTAPWWKQNNSAGAGENQALRFWIVCFKVLEILRKGRSKISFPE